MAQAKLKGKIALVTGAGKRLGRCIALELAREGMNVIVHYRTAAHEAEAVAEEIRIHGCEAWTLQANLADHEHVEKVIPRALELSHHLDLLVNNASIFAAETPEEATFERLEDAMVTNAWAPFALTRAFAMRVGHGMVINMLDSRVTGHDPGHMGYIVSKTALAAYTRICAVSYAPDVAVNAVAPGLVLSPVGCEDPSFLTRAGHTLPLHHHGDAEDVAAAVVYLAGTTFVTGEVIYVDGGRHLKEFGFGQDHH
jgi:pteridine reductase